MRQAIATRTLPLITVSSSRLATWYSTRYLSLTMSRCNDPRSPPLSLRACSALAGRTLVGTICFSQHANNVRRQLRVPYINSTPYGRTWENCSRHPHSTTTSTNILRTISGIAYVAAVETGRNQMPGLGKAWVRDDLQQSWTGT